MKSRLLLTPVAAATLAFAAQVAVAASQDASRPAADNRSTMSQTASPSAVGAQAAHDKAHRASKIIGKDVVNTQGERIGDIHDIVLDDNGNALYAVVSTGGFLGAGDRLHAVPWNSMQIDGGQRFVLDIDRDRLRNAPGFASNDWPDLASQQWQSQNQAHWSAGGQTTAAAGSARDRDVLGQQTTGSTGAASGDATPRPGMTGHTGGATPPKIGDRPDAQTQPRAASQAPSATASQTAPAQSQATQGQAGAQSSAATSPTRVAAADTSGKELAEKVGCNKCHAVETKKMASSYKDIAQRHKGNAKAQSELVAKLRTGTGHPKSNATEAELNSIIKWVLSM